MSSALRDQIVAALHTVFDPELPVNIYELGLIYNLQISDAGTVSIRMTLTSPNCPVADALVNQVKTKIAAIAGVSEANVELVFDPPWTPERMSDMARLELELRGIADVSQVHKKDRFTNVTIGHRRATK
jgi:FeS assembly SUF system protein